jgi:hypothetical protein
MPRGGGSLTTGEPDTVTVAAACAKRYLSLDVRSERISG